MQNPGDLFEDYVKDLTGLECNDGRLDYKPDIFDTDQRVVGEVKSKKRRNYRGDSIPIRKDQIDCYENIREHYSNQSDLTGENNGFDLYLFTNFYWKPEDGQKSWKGFHVENDVDMYVDTMVLDMETVNEIRESNETHKTRWTMERKQAKRFDSIEKGEQKTLSDEDPQTIEENGKEDVTNGFIRPTYADIMDSCSRMSYQGLREMEITTSFRDFKISNTIFNGIGEDFEDLFTV